jgi:hypothetical protein
MNQYAGENGHKDRGLVVYLVGCVACGGRRDPCATGLDGQGRKPGIPGKVFHSFLNAGTGI